jgi:hypothetical protein
MFRAPMRVLLPIWGDYVNFAPPLHLPERTPITNGILRQIDVIEFGMFAHLCRPFGVPTR